MPPRFFVDENMLAIGHALAAVREDVVYPGHPDLPDIPCGSPDSDWLPIVGAKGLDLVTITRDKKIRRKSIEAIALRDNAVRMFVLTSKQDLNRWGKLDLLVRTWAKIERYIEANGAGPWTASITTAGCKDMVLW